MVVLPAASRPTGNRKGIGKQKYLINKLCLSARSCFLHVENLSFFAAQQCPHHHLCIATRGGNLGSQKCVMDSEQGRLTHQDSHLLLAEEPAKDAGESESHPGARKSI